MKEFLLKDISECTIPLTRIVAEDDVEALCKIVRGLIKDKYMTVTDFCENLGLELIEIPNIVTYE